MVEFNIFGEIVDSECEKRSVDDLTPSDVNAFIKGLKSGDEVTFNINSPGGSVTAGISIANQIKKANSNGIKTTAKIDGICASIATVIMCACDNIVINDSAFIMIHNAWSIVQGDANTLRKEADTMDKMNKAILSFYRSKFSLTDEELENYMNEETWFSGSEAMDFKLKCNVVHDNAVKVAASLKKYNFKHLPKGLKMEEEKEVLEEEKIEETQIEEEKPVDEVTEEVEEKTEEKTEEVEEESVEDLKNKIEELEAKLAEYEKEDDEEEEMVTKEDCEKRVSGMQAKMQLQINDFVNQLKVREEELAKFKADAIRLQNELETSSNELSKVTSALVDKENALAQLNAGVNGAVETVNWRNLKGKEFWDFLKKHPELKK